jgi:L-fuculose-phosphate aldolase
MGRDLLMNRQEELKEEICELGKAMYHNHLSVANDGNISARLNQDEFLITPTRVRKCLLKPDKIVKVNLEGEVLDGIYRPSTEVKMHQRIYKVRSDVNAIVHFHSPYATAFATANIPLDKLTVPSVYCFWGEVPVSEYGTASTDELPDNIEKLILCHDAILLCNHGALTVGRSLEEAYVSCERLELYAQVSLFAKLLGGARELNAEERQRLIEKRDYQKKAGLL